MLICDKYYNIDFLGNFNQQIGSMSINIVETVLGNEFNVGEVDSNSITLSSLVRKMREVCRIKVRSVEEVKIYVKLSRGNELCQISNCAELH